jgi:predicted MFS family arabinose efflux permease
MRSNEGERRSPRLRALAHRDFRVLWLGMVFASGTMAFQYYAQIWLIYSLTGSALLLGVLGAARGAGMLLAAMYGGVLADRLDRRTLLMIIEASTLVLSATLAILAITDRIELWQAFVLIFLASGVQSIEIPIRQALIPELVDRDDISNAVALTTAARMGSFAFFPVIAGFIIDAIEPGGAYAVSTIGNIIGIGVLLALRYRGQSREARQESMLRSIRDGLAYARRDPAISSIVAVMLVMGALGFAIYTSLIGKWASEELALTPGQYGVLAAVWGVGTLVAAYALAFAGDFPHKGKAFVAGSVAFGLSLVLFSLTRSLPVAGFAYLVNGVAWTAASISATTIVQLIVPNDVRGRVMSLFALHMALSQMNGATLGAIADSVGLEALMVGTTTVCTAVVAIMVLVLPNLRHLDRRVATASPAAV